MTYIKPDPEMQQDQEDLIMSYLNADYLSTENTPLSPPSSVTTSSASSSGGLSPPEKHMVDDFMLDINSTDFLTSDADAWATGNLFNPCFPQQQQTDLLGTFPFFLPATTSTAATVPNFIQPFPTPTLLPPTVNTTTTTTSSSSSTGSLSDSEQPKKKRGRKKREPVIYQTSTPVSPSLLAPKPLAPRPNQDVIKSEPVIISTTTSATTTTTTTTTPISSSSPQPPSTTTSSEVEVQKQAQIQKRQERLIKNRAAALLSRKRKREHLTCLEEEKQLLVNENEELNSKVGHLESRIKMLEKENLDLKQRLQLTSSSSVIQIGNNKRPLGGSPKSTKATGVVFMIILFSFALFTLPSRTTDRLTVGGSMMMNTKKQFPLIAGGNTDIPSHPMADNNILPTTDLVLIDSVVQPRDLQTWINHKVDTSSSDGDVIGNSGELQTWSHEQQRPRHVYLYSKEFSQIAPIHMQQQPPLSTSHNNDLPILSLISPYNQTFASDDDDDNYPEGCHHHQFEKYLQIDVQVLRSQVIRSQLMPLNQCDSTLLEGMDIISSNHHNNVTPPVATTTKREKRVTAANKKLARVIV